MQFVFGSGLLFAQPEGFDNRANSPVQVGALRGVSVDMGFNPKSLHGGGHWPLAIGRGTGKVPCKADFAQFSADGFNALFFGGPVPTTGCTRTAVDEAQVIAGNAAMATHAASFAMDLGVTAELPSGALFTRVASAPGAQQYTCNESTGAYGFAPGTDGNAVRLSYLYSDTSNGRQITIANRFIGHTPRFSAVLTETFNGKAMTLVLPHCVASRLTLASKQSDFMVPSFVFSAAADDSGLVGIFNVEEGSSPPDGACFVESFAQGLGPYTHQVGNTSIFSVIEYDGHLTALVLPIFGGNLASIGRPLPQGQVATAAFTAQFKITGINPTDDCAGINLVRTSDGAETLSFQPRTAVGTHGAAFTMIGGEQAVGAIALSADTWYQVDATVAPGAGNTKAVISLVADGSVVETLTTAGSYSPTSFDRFQLLVDGTGTATTYFRAIEACPLP